MRTSDISESREAKTLALKLENETVAWRDSRPTRPKFSMEGVQVVRVPKRRVRSIPSTTDVNRP